MANENPTPAPATAVAAKACKSRVGIFIYNLVVIAVLAVIGVVYMNGGFTLQAPYKLPIQAMWFGALGGIVISLKGVYDHSCERGDWDDGFCLWHIGRPISGAITGLLTMVLLQAVNPGSDLTASVVYTVAFIFGTQERRFFNFLSEVAALVVKTPDDDQDRTLKATGIDPLEGRAGALVIISGNGFGPNATVTFGSVSLTNVTVSKDGKTIAGIAPAGTGSVDIAITNADGKRFVLADKFTYTA